MPLFELHVEFQLLMFSSNSVVIFLSFLFEKNKLLRLNVKELRAAIFAFHLNNEQVIPRIDL